MISKPEQDNTLEQRLVLLNSQLRHASAQAVLRAAISVHWPGRITYLSSFGAESVVMLALIAEVEPDLPVQFLDTLRHFPQTLDYRDEVIARLGLTNVRTVRPGEAESRILDPDGKLWSRDPDGCCALRKVRPLGPALDGFEAWITGRKRFHGAGRATLRVIDHAEGRYKVNPLASWTQEDVDRFIRDRDLPRHPLVAQGYASIGCWPCTAPVSAGSPPRAGRWAGTEKTECGLHAPRPAVRPRVF